ncbi:hypothetical protein DID80_02825 [Candidatus Marinamargulisbacteria bacterium SCGC AAA071-K20]|nr:hypothetical protein DID80_02825 [Candidatus Marinamargulisbacteria bacterium SCGC AAA071-K20]
MSEKKKTRYTKGMELVSKVSSKKILFGSFNDEDVASCLTADKMFVNISREELDRDYVSLKQLHGQSREKRRGQGW